MEPSAALPPQAVEILARGGTVLTSNQRAARTLRLAFDRRSLALGLATWQPPRIFAWDNWIAQLWHQAILAGKAERLLLNHSQELHLWRSIIAADTRRNFLQSLDPLAELAASAWQLLCAYRGQSRLRTLGVSEDTRTFQRWATTFIQRCNSSLYLSQSELETFLAGIVSKGDLPYIDRELLLIGFDNRTPAQTRLLGALIATGVDISSAQPGPPALLRHIAASISLEAELTTAALWLRATLELNPAARIAVIHPSLFAVNATERAEIDRTFRHILAPELENIASGIAHPPFEFSLGQPLLFSPMAAVAVEVLRWIESPLAIEDLSRLLLSPFFCPAAELNVRAEFDAQELRRLTTLRPELNLESFLHLVEGSRRVNRLPSLLTQLRAMHRTANRLIPELARQKSYAEWADIFRELLRSAAWAAARPDSTADFQTRRKWEGALDELATLDFEGTRPAYSAALDALEGILRRTLFAPESREAPIQIMSPQEAAGSRFDALYFLRCSDLAWPPTPGINPLLGWHLQRDLQMPGSDPIRDTAHARAVTARLAASAPVAVFSYARETTEGHHRPSPLLATLALEPLDPPAVPEPPPPIALERIADPGLIPLANPKVRGGSNILKLQAACGFRAFAEIRLASKPLESAEPGLDATERGSIVHAVMAHLWNDLRTQAALLALTPAERAAQLDRSISAALADTTNSAASTWDNAYLEVQHKRLQRLLRPWLDLESMRSPFEVVSSEQLSPESHVGPLILAIRVDRVDRALGDERGPADQIILDYKTGVAHTSDWLEERPEDPQLPLYAILAPPQSLAAVGFAHLRPGKDLDLTGFADDSSLIPKAPRGKVPALGVQIENWRRILTQLAQDFASGDASVRPKTYPETCKYCAQRMLCRVDPALLELDLEDDEEDEEEELAGPEYANV